MDAINNAMGLSLTCSNDRPLPLKQWMDRYDAMSFEQDWWFKAGAAIARFVAATAKSVAAQIATPALRAAQA